MVIKSGYRLPFTYVILNGKIRCSDSGEPFGVMDVKNLIITMWYAFMWSWILFKLKREILYKSLKK